MMSCTLQQVRAAIDRALAFAEAGLTEEFLAAREALREAEAERMRQIAALDRRIDSGGVWVV